MGGAGGSYSATTSHMGKCMALLMHLNCCNFRPTGPFGISLRAGCVIHGALGLIPHLSGIWEGRWWLIWAICWLFNAPHKIFRHSGRRLCPLTKSVGLQTSSMSFPPTYDSHKNIRWSKMRCFVLRRCGFRRPYAKCAVGQRKIGFGGAADAAEMRNRFAFAILTFS